MKKTNKEVPEEAIEAAEAVRAAHSHDDVWPDDDSLVEHLQTEHGLDTDPQLSGSTQQGLHDRLHHESDALDD